MMSITFDELYWVELLLFYVLALGVLFLPLRWSLLCLLLAGSVEVMRPDFMASASIGWENAVERMLLPILLLLRLTRYRLPRIPWNFASKTWVALILYAAVSVLWSPFKLSGLKMVAYLAAWFVLYMVFDLAWNQGLLNQRTVIEALWGSIGLACLQTYVLGNPLFGIEGRLGEFASAQFAPFTGPQSFGPFLACLLSLLLFSKERRDLRVVSIGACLLSLVLVGSRYALIEAAIVALAWCLLRVGAVPGSGSIRVTHAFTVLLVVGVSVAGLGAVMKWIAPDSRVNQLLELKSDVDLAEAGTFGWRLVRYTRALTTLSERSLMGLTFGSGTSSGAEVAMADPLASLQDDDLEDMDTLDPNRAIHDEFLRAEYEWGFIGLGLGLILLIYSTRELWVRAFRWRSLSGFAGLVMMPGIVLALLVENPLAGPGGAASFGYLLVLTYGFSCSRRAYAKPLVRTADKTLSERRRLVLGQDGSSEPAVG
jgi:hypothetical protein